MTGKTMRNACYNCKYRREIFNDAHSRCAHPTPGLLGIEADAHGIDSGWFNHPANFDPVWLLKCAGFEAIGGGDG
jgi:hypothetical protein